ncbi:MAG: hypothetical protein HY889_06845 [Deltaproteobacteria bacterium]|nr:hypothetical protein [Deltaproteobacteria bacterium]
MSFLHLCQCALSGVARVIKERDSPIGVPVGVEAQTSVPTAKEMKDEEFEKKIKETFGIW